MNQGHVEEELLHRYFDGDLHASQADEVARHIGGCSECGARHRELSELRRMVEVSTDEAMRDVDFDALYGRIERGIREQHSAPGLLERLSVWLRDLAEQRPARLWVPVAGAVAAAAVLLLISRETPERELPQAANPAPAPAEIVAETAEPAAAQEPEPEPPLREHEAMAAVSSEVVQVDFGSSAGTVYEIALADGVSTPVVWINDDAQDMQ